MLSPSMATFTNFVSKGLSSCCRLNASKTDYLYFSAPICPSLFCYSSISLVIFIASRLRPHRIPVSARANTSGEIVRPICFSLQIDDQLDLHWLLFDFRLPDRKLEDRILDFSCISFFPTI